MPDRDSLARLTEREKVCLRQWLQHKSAKEIAVELGISHHAVEKRLKMARTKLGATSSLEAARLLGEAEGYGRTVAQPPELAAAAPAAQAGRSRSILFGVAIMILVGAIVLGLSMQPAAFSQASSPAVQAASAGPTAGTEAALRTLVAGLASGSPDYAKLSPPFAAVVRNDLPATRPWFQSMGELKSVTYQGRGAMGDDVYNLTFAKGAVVMSAKLDTEGRMAGGILQPAGSPGEQGAAAGGGAPRAGTEAALRSLVAGLASGSPDYARLSPQFAATVRRDLPATHPWFESMGALKSIAYQGRGGMGDDVYALKFEKGAVVMSAAMASDGKMAGGILRPADAPAR